MNANAYIRHKLSNFKACSTKIFETCENYFTQSLRWLDSLLQSFLVRIPTRRWRRSRLKLKVEGVDHLEALASKNLWVAALVTIVAFPLLKSSYLLFDYNAGENGRLFIETFTIPILNHTIDNPFYNYGNWYWLTYRFGEQICPVVISIAWFYTVRGKARWLPCFVIGFYLYTAIEMAFAPSGRFEYSWPVTVGLFSVAFYEAQPWLRSKILKVVSAVGSALGNLSVGKGAVFHSAAPSSFKQTDR